MTAALCARAFAGIVVREWLRFVHQRGRFFAALVRPLVWLVIFAAGFRMVLGVSPIPPHRTYISYEEYVVPGLIGMILLFNGMQTALSIVYDPEMGSMKVLLTSPLPRGVLLTARLFAARAWWRCRRPTPSSPSPGLGGYGRRWPASSPHFRRCCWAA